MKLPKSVILGCIVVIIAIICLFIYGQMSANAYTQQLDAYISKQTQRYQQTTASYRAESDRLSNTLVAVSKNKKLKSFEDKILAQSIIFDRLESSVKVIATADKAFVDGLSEQLPRFKANALLAILNPGYKKAKETSDTVQQTIANMKRYTAAEQFIVDQHVAYFDNTVRYQAFIQLRAIAELADAFSGALPKTERLAVEKKQQLQTYRSTVNTYIPGLTNILNDSPLPNHPYYQKKREHARAVLSESKKMYSLYLKDATSSDPAVKKQADAMAAKNDELKKYGNVVLDVLLQPLKDLGGIENGTKKLFSL